MRGVMAVALGLCCLMLSSRAASAAAPTDAATRAGAAIYLRGIRPDGKPLEGTRPVGPGLGVRGRDAACVSCHQHSGLGTQEGTVVVPPIAGRYLFAAPASAPASRSARARPGDSSHAAPGTFQELPFAPTARFDRGAYTEATFLRALRDGIDPDGRRLGVLMPRYRIETADARALLAYLNTLEPVHVPGVDASVLHFATIITPDADPARAGAMLNVLEHFFAEKNNFPISPSPRMRAGGLGYYTRNMYRANRLWRLHVWRLVGPPKTWRAQLDADMAREPVMAIISGLGRNTWGPVHGFCEAGRIPCLFPNVDVPVVAPGDFYSLYFSRGVLLEAGLIAGAIGRDQALHRVLQVYRPADSGEQAAHVLASLLHQSNPRVRDDVLALAPTADIASALTRAPPADVWVLWLRPHDLARLGSTSKAPARVFVSGLMGGLESAPLPTGWRARVRMAYPVDLPGKRRVRLDFPLGWFRFQHIPVVDERMQVDTYLACGVLSETLSGMSDNLQRDYLIEMLERMLEHRFLTGYYPRLTLAPGESFASRGAYLVKFAGSSNQPAADGGWTVP